MKPGKKIIGIGVLTAISASLCCITPVLALLAGTSGLASAFSWIEPFRPYLIGITFLLLGFAWFQKLKPKSQIKCDCDVKGKTTFTQTKRFLGIVTIFALLMLAFPMYAHIFYPKPKKQTEAVTNPISSRVEFKIKGMNCAGCESLVSYEINKLTGIRSVTVSYLKENAVVEFDQAKSDIGAIEKAISGTGYSVTGKTVIK